MEANNWIQLIHIALGHREAFDAPLSDTEWRHLYVEAQRQAVAGVLFTAVERLPADQRPPRPLLWEWMALVRHVEQRSHAQTCETVRVAQQLEADGFPAVLLKGVGVAHYYPNPLRRMPGDIDIWVRRSRSDLTAYARGFCQHPVATSMHVEVPLSPQFPVELHFTPSYMYFPLAGRRLQRWFSTRADAEFDNRAALGDEQAPVCQPTDQFNRVYLLLHMYRHLLGDGIGLRHLLDYYFLLTRAMSDAELEAVRSDFKELGLTRFARAVMYIMQSVLLLPQSQLIVPPDKVSGQRLWHDIGATGNFGHHDESVSRARNAAGRINRLTHQCQRIVRFFPLLPMEVICAPLWRVSGFVSRRIIHRHRKPSPPHVQQ